MSQIHKPHDYLGFAEPTHSISLQHPTSYSHIFKHRSGSCPEQPQSSEHRATGTVLFSRAPRWLLFREGRGVLIQPPNSRGGGGGSNTSVTSAPLSERVTTAKISHVKPIKVCLTVVLRMKQIHFQPNLAHINPLCQILPQFYRLQLLKKVKYMCVFAPYNVQNILNICCVLLFGFVAVLQDFFRYYVA